MRLVLNIRVERIISANELRRHENYSRQFEAPKYRKGNFEVGDVAVIERNQCRFLWEDLVIVKAFHDGSRVDSIPTLVAEASQIVFEFLLGNIRPCGPPAGRATHLVIAKDREVAGVHGVLVGRAVASAY